MPHFRPPDPPACGTVVGHQFPTPSHGLPTPIFEKPEKSSFRKNDDGSRKSPTTFFYNILKEIIYNRLYILEIFDSGESLRDANTYGLAPRSVVSNTAQRGGCMLSVHRNKKNS